MSGFVDEVEILIASGHGGAGCVSFRREKYVPRGGPDGGDGGQGGNILFEVRRNLKTLSHLRGHKQYRAQNGRHGSGRKKHGANGQDMIIAVPPGTIVRNLSTGEVLMDLIDEGQHTVLIGGIGGKGNSNFATSRRQAPRFAQDGIPGEELNVKLELNLIADIGFVGLPNAGKSSLLNVLTSAHPKIGAYPFTTKIPNLGVMTMHQHDIVLADIPGLIEGASSGAGLGIRFLKHISRTKALAFVIDSSDETLDLGKVYTQLNTELIAYDQDMADKPRIILLNKIDVPEGRSRAEEAVKDFFSGFDVVLFSAAMRENIETVSQSLFELAEIQKLTITEHGIDPTDDTIKAPSWMESESKVEEEIIPEDPESKNFLESLSKEEEW